MAASGHTLNHGRQGTGSSLPPPVVFVPFDPPATTQPEPPHIEPPHKKQRTGNQRRTISQAVADSCLRDLQGQILQMTCKINNCEEVVGTSESAIKQHLQTSHSLSADGRRIAGIEEKGCPWPGCGGRKNASVLLSKHILKCHVRKGLFECAVCGRKLNTTKDAARAHVYNCVAKHPEKASSATASTSVADSQATHQVDERGPYVFGAPGGPLDTFDFAPFQAHPNTASASRMSKDAIRQHKQMARYLKTSGATPLPPMPLPTGVLHEPKPTRRVPTHSTTFTPPERPAAPAFGSSTVGLFDRTIQTTKCRLLHEDSSVDEVPSHFPVAAPSQPESSLAHALQEPSQAPLPTASVRNVPTKAYTTHVLPIHQPRPRLAVEKRPSFWLTTAGTPTAPESDLSHSNAASLLADDLKGKGDIPGTRKRARDAYAPREENSSLKDTPALAGSPMSSAFTPSSYETGSTSSGYLSSGFNTSVASTPGVGVASLPKSDTDVSYQTLDYTGHMTDWDNPFGDVVF